MKQIISCPICGNKECKQIHKRKLVYPAGRLEDHLSDFDFVRNKILFDTILRQETPIEFVFKICINCGFIFFSPRCEEEDYLVKFVEINRLGTDLIKEKVVYMRTYDDGKAHILYKRLSKIYNINNSIIIDVGGAHGLYLKYFLPCNTCYVVDYVKYDLAKGVKYLCNSTEGVPESVKADIVLFCHTLEHVLDPVKEIKNIIKLLKPGGLLYIEVPPGCWQQEYKHIGSFITHINFFSEGSLWHLLDVCGLKIKYLKLKPLIGRIRYEPIIMAIAEKSTVENQKVNGYQITSKHMKGRHILLRTYTNLLSLRLMKLKYFVWIFRKIKMALLRNNY